MVCPGEYWLEVFLNPQNRIKELDTANNRYFIPMALNIN